MSDKDISVKEGKMENEGQKISEEKAVNAQNKREKNPDNKENQKSNKYRRPRKHYSQNKRNYNKPAKYDRNKKLEDNSKFKFKIVSVLVPLFNEDESLKMLSNEIAKVFDNISPDYEILFIDDGSTDNSLKIIKELASSNHKIRYISFRKNYGKSAALNVGFKNVIGDIVVTMDADLQDDPAEIPNLLRELQKGYDLVSGWKKHRHDPFVKKYSSRFFNYVTKIMSGINIHDFNCGLKAYKKNVVKSITVQGELHRYIPVLADWRGFKVSEVIVKHHPRKYGKTKFGISRFFKGFIDLITVIFTTRYIQRPLHFFGMLGVITFIAGFTIDAYLSILWFLDKINLSNRPILLSGNSVNNCWSTIFLGLIGEMLVHNKKEDSYGVKEKKLKIHDSKGQK